MALFLRSGDDLAALTEKPYAKEDELQGLLARFPDLLPGEDIEPDDPRQFLLVRREAPVAGLFVDHLFLDQDAVPTLVEVKRVENSQLRREVLAQVLDYAANAALEWDSKLFAAWFDEQCISQGKDPSAELEAFGHAFESDADYWDAAQTNIHEGKVRLIVLAASIPDRLRVIVEYVNERMNPTTVLAVEVTQHATDSGEVLLQSRLIGQTGKARAIKGSHQRPVLAALLEDGHLRDGQDLWLLLKALPIELRPEDPEDARLRFVLRGDGGAIRLTYAPVGGIAEDIAPSKAPDRARQVFDPAFKTLKSRAVHNAFSREPGGQTLGELAREVGVWDDLGG